MRWYANRLGEFFVVDDHIGGSDGGATTEARCSQMEVARDAVIGSVFVNSTLHPDVPVPFVIDDWIRIYCFNGANVNEGVPIFSPKFWRRQGRW